jgi:two-component system, NtrC family, sensor kinase
VTARSLPRALSVAPPPPRSSIATRILASFAVTVIAFATTVGLSIYAQRRAVDDHQELANGYLPAALKLGQLRATQATVTTLVEGVIYEEKNPLSTRLLLETLVRVRRAKYLETHIAMNEGLRNVGRDDTRRLSGELTSELDGLGTVLADDTPVFERLFAALNGGDEDQVNRTVMSLSRLEPVADTRLRALSDRVATAMDNIASTAKERERRAILALITLSVLTIGVGVAVSIHTRKLLAPLGRVTERARAVAHGDLTPREMPEADDEIGQLARAFERMVEAVARAQSQALSNERLAAIGKMAAHVTHEIRNPLSSIGLNIEMLEDELAGGDVPGDARALLKSISREVQRLEHLSEEYLRVARLPSPRMEADDVATVLREIVTFARPEVEHAGCSLELDVRDPMPPAFFDDAQLRQAVLNLLRNAREAMPEGGPIELAIHAEGMSVVIEISDRGGGIPDNIRARVFDPFFSTKGEGTGLGLAITRHIVEAHGGLLTCEARDGGGTRFRIALPIAPSRRARAPIESGAAGA